MADAYQNRDAARRQALLEQHLLNTVPAPAEPSISELVQSLVSDAQVLLRKEFTLARYEVQQELDKVRQGATILAIGATILGIGSLFVLVAFVQGLVVWFDLAPWVSYLIVGAVLALVGMIFAAMGSERLKQVHPMPEQAIDSVRKDLSWAKEQKQSEKI